MPLNSHQQAQTSSSAQAQAPPRAWLPTPCSSRLKNVSHAPHSSCITCSSCSSCPSSLSALSLLILMLHAPHHAPHMLHIALLLHIMLCMLQNIHSSSCTSCSCPSTHKVLLMHMHHGFSPCSSYTSCLMHLIILILTLLMEWAQGSHSKYLAWFTHHTPLSRCLHNQPKLVGWNRRGAKVQYGAEMLSRC